ncbi:MAG: FecR domain-containing protein [Candidatus Peregrinibacteria bacterium]|nr:FecR domain-containing protein [Candidatus Peregrinibacteria bacterium]
MERIKKGFTLVELLIVVAILAVLSGAAYIGIQRAQVRVMNEKMLDDLQAISNALEQYKQDNNGYPVPTTGEDKNVNCFYADTAYAHECAGAAFVQAMVDNKLLTKRYLQEVPTDPRTGSRYVYGVTADGKYFQVAGNYMSDDGLWIAKSQGNLAKGYSLPSVIRAFDGPNFVMNDGGYLPYSPDHLSITARVEDPVGTVKIDGNPASEGDLFEPGMTITVGAGASVVLYFSDGSISYLGDAAEETVLQLMETSEVLQNDAESTGTKVDLKLDKGKIWNKVVRLSSASEFNVETTSAIAGVKGTEFGVQGEKVLVKSGEVLLSSSDPTSGAAVKVVADQVADSKSFSAQASADLVNAASDPYNKVALSNNVEPIIKSVDMSTQTVVIEKLSADPNSGASYEDIKEVIVIDEKGTEQLLAVTTDPDGNYLINNAPTGSVEFKLVDVKGNESGISTKVQLSRDTVLTKDQLYGTVQAPTLTRLTPKEQCLADGGSWNDVDQTCQSALQVACNNANGYWDGSACWVLGAAGESCDAACNSGIVDVAGNGGIASCDTDPTWNDCGANGVCSPDIPDGDDCSICNTLTGGAQCSAANFEYAPYNFFGCAYRVAGQGAPDQNCTARTPNAEERVCKCI